MRGALPRAHVHTCMHTDQHACMQTYASHLFSKRNVGAWGFAQGAVGRADGRRCRKLACELEGLG